MTIAVDFDGTLAETEYPDIIAANEGLMIYLQAKRQKGAKVILFTCREGEALQDAIDYCKAYGLEFDAVNDNPPQNIEWLGGNPRKVFADIYIDDKSSDRSKFGLPFKKRKPVMPEIEKTEYGRVTFIGR